MSKLIKENELEEIFATSASIDHEEYVIVHYRIIPGEGLTIDETAALLAVNTSLGTIKPLNYENSKSRMKASAKVLFTAMSGELGRVDIAYPIDLCEPAMGLTQLLSVIWYTSEYNFTLGYWVEDIDFPKSFLRHYKGPKYGIEGIRQSINIPSRPILGAIIKPRGGTTLEPILKASYECLMGGFDYIIDDELIVNPKGELSFENRVPKLVEIVQKASHEKGEKKWYFANINASPQRALLYARKAKEMGVNGLQVNAFTMGFPAFEDIASQIDIDLPIITCNMGTAVMTRPKQFAGASEVFISKLSRIAGADGVYSGIVGSSWYSMDVFRASMASLRKSFYDLKRTFPVVAGGLNLANLGENLVAQGTDILLQAGTSVMGFPTGPRNGAMAFRTIVENFNPSMGHEEMEQKLIELGKKYQYVRDGLTAYGFKPKLSGK
jgi:ribulose 1,5-bisphosphate carboxylase large subunit-like protein